jgi:hypothetical protein
MTRLKKELQVLNVNLTLQLGEGRNYWSEPNVTRYENFEIPLRMFTVKALADLINDMVNEMPEELKEEIARVEAEHKDLEEAAKAQIESELKAEAKVDF